MAREIELRETMWATMRPDIYGGDNCDEVMPNWYSYADGDKQGGDDGDLLQLSARTFPPGTKITIAEPVCPGCGETRTATYPAPETGRFFAPKCDCGFDWESWVQDEYA